MPLQTPSLALEASELAEMVNPVGDDNGFSFGNDPGIMSESSVIKLMAAEEESMLSRLPESYMTIIRGHVDGEYLTDKQFGAKANQTSFKLSLAPVDPDSLRLFVNYHSNSKPWRSRTHADAMSALAYALDDTTGDIVLSEGLEEGSQLIAEYRHQAASSLSAVRNLVLKASRLELYNRFPNYQPDSADLTALREQIDSEVLSFYGADGSARGINVLDKMVMVVENRQSGRKPLKMPFLGGW